MTASFRKARWIVVVVILSLLGGIFKLPSVEAKAVYVDAPTISIDTPTDPFLGTVTTFSVSFENNSSLEGFGPFLNIFIDKTGVDGRVELGVVTDSLDGLGNSNLTVAYGDFTFPSSDIFLLTLDENRQVEHPFLKDASGAATIITAPTDFVEGDVMLVVRLPYGSFVPTQPKITLDISVDISPNADLNQPLHVAAQGGYQFGGTAVDDYASDDPSTTLSGMTSGTITPTLITLEKSNNAPEGQTATGPNYLRTYTITAEVAAGQTLTDVDITDSIPANVQYVGPATTSSPATCSHSEPSAPGGSLTCNFATLSGTVTISFPYYVPRVAVDSSDVINPQSGAPVNSCNNVSALGDWTPVDGRDPGALDNVSAGSAAAPCENNLSDHAVIVYKQTNLNTDNGAAGTSPADILTHTLNFDISDYFAMDDLVLTDILSDGQRFDPSFTPTLVFNGNSYALTAESFSTSNYSIQCNYSTSAAYPCSASDPDGTSTLVFRVSDEIRERGENGQLIGGCIDPATGSAAPECTAYDNGATQGVIVYQSVILNAFTDAYDAGHTASVDQGDILRNDVEINGQLLNPADFSTDGMGTPNDNSSTRQEIIRSNLVKSIYAVNGLSPASPARITAGDEVTYRLRYELTTSDVEDLYFQDFFPLPIYSVNDPDGDGTAGEAWAFSSNQAADPTESPASGIVSLGPDDTFFAYSGLSPVVTSEAGQNRVDITYGSYDKDGSARTVIDLLLTATVTDRPFADGLYLTNQAFVHEGSTNSGAQNEDALVQLIFTAPSVSIQKSILYSDGNGSLNPDPVGPAGVTWAAPGSAPRWTGVINSSNYSASVLNSNLVAADAGDLVTFAIVLENTGSGVSGAHDLVVRDVAPVEYAYPTDGDGNSINLQVYDGSGTRNIAYTQSDGGPVTNMAAALFGSGIKLDDNGDEGAAKPYDAENGRNLIVITYDLRLTSSAVLGAAYTNTASLTNYAAQENGTNFATPIPSESANLTIQEPELSKTVDKSDAVIGEVVTYTLTATLPEGSLPNAHVLDTLANGLALISVDSIVASSGVSIEDANLTTNTSVTNSGRTVDIHLGDVVNANSSPATAETITIVYRAVVLNITANQSGVILTNTAALTWDSDESVAPNPEFSLSAASPQVVVREPVVTFSKTVARVLPSAGSAVDAGDTVQYVLTLTNTSAYSAYDVTVSDTLPALLINPEITAVSDTATVDPLTAGNFSLAGNALTTVSGTDLDLPANNARTVSITIRAVVANSIQPGNSLINAAQVRWTSLDGAIEDVSSYNTASDERTGADGPSGALNDYALNRTASINAVAMTGAKYLIGSSESGTAAARLTIGEIARYRLVLALPEGTHTDLAFLDRLPMGMRFLNDDTGRVAFISTSGITSDTLSDPDLATAPALNLLGSTATAAAPTSASIDFPLPGSAISTSPSADIDSYTNGTDVYFKLGTLTNLSENDSDTEYAVIEFNVLIENISANQAINNSTGAATATTTLNNSFVASVNTATSPLTRYTSGNTAITIAEPSIHNLTKSVAPTQAEAGDTVAYTLTFSNSNLAAASPAYDVILTDTVPAKMDLNLSSLTIASVASCAGTPANTSSGNDIHLEFSVIPTGCAVTITYNAVLTGAVIPSELLTNTARVTYTSLPLGFGTASSTTENPTINLTGSTLSSANGNTPAGETGERTGSGPVGGLNDFLDTAAINVNITAVAPEKSLVSTTDPHTLANNLTIGESARFRMQVQLAQTTSPNFTIVDNLPDGLIYSGNAKVALVSGAAGNCPGSATMNSTTLGDAPWVCGDDTTVATITPTYDLPTDVVSGAPFLNGTDPIFALGQIVNADNDDANLEYVIVEFDVVVANTLANQTGTSLTNTFTVFINSENKGTSTGATLNLVEPAVTINKTVSPAVPPFNAGDVLTYTLSIRNTSAISAYNVEIEDDPFTNYVLDSGDMSVDSGVLGTVTDHSTSDQISFTISEIPAGQTITIPYSVTLPNTIIVGETVENTGLIQWTSQPTLADTVRTGVDGAAGLNNYTSQDPANFTVENPSLTKSVSAATATIGETVTYTLTVTAPDATIPDLVITDQLPANLLFSGETPTYTNWSSAASFSAPAPATSSDPTMLTWDFGDLVVTDSPMTITYTAIVANVAANQAGVTITNAAELSYTDKNGVPRSLSDDVSFEVVEPTLEIVKSASSATFNPGETVTYSVAVRHTAASTADAFDIVLTDLIPSGLEYSDPSGEFTGTLASLPLGDTYTFNYDVLVTSAAILGSTITNTADLTWTSTPGANLNERTAPVDGTDTLNTYTTTDTADIHIPLPTFTKTASPENAPVGAEVTYTLTLTPPLGTLPNVVITDALPANLIFSGAYILNSNWPNSSPGFTQTPPAAAGDPTSLSWDFGTLTFDASPLTITFTALVANDSANQDGVEITNTAQLTYSDAAGDPQSLDAQASIEVIEPALEITKSANASQLIPGAAVTYTLNVAHTAASTATAYDLTISDLIPAGLTYQAGSITGATTGSGSVSPNDSANPLAWTISELADGQTATLTYAVRVDDDAPLASELTNSAGLVWTSQPDTPVNERSGSDGAGGLNDYAAATAANLTVTGIDLSISKDDGLTDVNPGDTLTYAVTYSNSGNAAASDVLLTETLPQFTRYTSGSVAWTCNDPVTIADRQVCTYTMGSVAAGASGSMTISAAVSANLPGGTLNNSALVNDVVIANQEPADGYDPPANNTATDTDHLLTSDDMQVSKVADHAASEPYAPGQTILYTVTYTNTGRNDQTNVILIEQLPENTLFNAPLSSGWVFSDPLSTANGRPTYTYSVGAVAHGISDQVQFAVDVLDPLPVGVTQIFNEVKIQYPNEANDPTPQDNSASVSVDIQAQFDLSISKEDGIVQTSPGSTLTYTLLAHNEGNQNASGVTVIDTLPAGLTFVSATQNGQYDASTRKITWQIGALNGGDDLTLKVTATVNDPFDGDNAEVINTVEISDDGTNGPDPTPENNTSSDRDLISASGKSLVATNLDATQDNDVAIGETLTYQVTLNIAPGSVSNLTLTDVVDPGLAFIGCETIHVDDDTALSLAPGVTLTNICQQAAIHAAPPGSTETINQGRQMELTFGTLENTSSADINLTVQYTVVVLNIAENVDGAQMANTATWTWDGGELLMAAAPVTILEPDLELTKTVTPVSVFNGEEVTYTLEIRHTSQSHTHAYNLLLNDVLPVSLTYVPDSLAFVSGQMPTTLLDTAAPTLRIGWDEFTLSETKTVLTFKAKVTQSTPGDTISNLAVLSWTSLPDQVTIPQSEYNSASDERSYQPDSPVNTYGASGQADFEIPSLPETGFAPGRRTTLPAQWGDSLYHAQEDLRLVIRKQNLDLPIVGVPLTNSGWDLTWLGRQIGYLEGTTYPTWDGNTVLTAHVYDADGNPGPFVNLHLLRWGDSIELHAYGKIYTYEVRKVEKISTENSSPLLPQDKSTLTLITCQGYNETTGKYDWRIAVQAVLISVTPQN